MIDNFPLFTDLRASGSAPPRPLPPFRSTEVVDGYSVTLHGAGRIKAVDPVFADVKVTDSRGRPVPFTEWYGALAHAIFFRAGSLDYFHTHVCGLTITACSSGLGAAQVVGKSKKPGPSTSASCSRRPACGGSSRSSGSARTW